MARKTGSATTVARPPKVVRKPKGEAAAGPAKVAKGAKKKASAGLATGKVAETATGAGKRKRRAPTKRELHRRLMYDKRVARAINDEQKRAQDRTASSRKSFKREIKEVLEKIQKEKLKNPDDEIVIPSVGTKAVSILHAIAEDEIIGLFNEASFLLEYAKKATLTPEGLQALLSIRRARNKEPTYDPETRPQPTTDPAAAAEEDAEEAAAYSDDDSDSASDGASDNGSVASSE